MLPGDFDASADVRALVTYAIVNGVRRDIESVSFDNELSGDLPEQVVSGGLAGGDGTVVWAAQHDVEHREVSPWHKVAGWPPSAGDRFQVYVTDGTTSWPRFTGVIDKTTGTVGGQMRSTFIDFRDRLNHSISYAAQLRQATPFQPVGGAYRAVGLSHWHVLCRALRHVGVYNVPHGSGDIALEAPMQGSLLPQAGVITGARGANGSVNTYPGFHHAPWGNSVGGFTADYEPVITRSMTQPVQVTLMVAEDHAGDASIRVFYGSNDIQLRVFPNRVVYANLNGSNVVQLGPSSIHSMTMVTLLVKNNVWELRANNGQSSQAQRTVPSSAAMTSIVATAEAGARIAGLLVEHPQTSSHEFSPMRWTRNFSFTDGNLGASLDMSRRIENERVADIVEEICKATLTAAWWDETGNLRMVRADVLRNGTPVQTITTLDDITELPWEDSLLSVRSRVEVSWKRAEISKGRHRRIELFRGSGDSMESADVVEVFATPDNKTEWFGVSWQPDRLDDSNWGYYNRKIGSFVGVYYIDGNDDELATSARSTSIHVERIGTVGLKITHVAGHYGTNVEANLGVSENSTSVREPLRGDALPVIRGHGSGVWVDDTYTSTITGPSYAQTLVHDLGHWGHRVPGSSTIAARIANFIAQQVTTPTPTLRNVRVTYDPRRQIGDQVTIRAGILDITVRALIVGIHETHEAGAHTQQLSLRVISVNSTRRATYTELETAWEGGSYQGLQTVWSGLTYEDFENNPLEGAPNQ